MDLGEPKTGGRADGREGPSRRGFLRAAGGAAAAGLAGCTGVLGGGSIDTISIAYKPIFPFLQYLVMDERGYLDELDAEVEGTNFADQGLNVVSAYADGDVDVAFIGITPAIRMRHRGVPGRVTAANHTGGFVVFVTEPFADLWDEHGVDAFDAFREREGRPFRFSTFPGGSVANVLLHEWLDAELGVGTDPVEIENMAGAGPVRRSLLSGNADGTLIMEPIPTKLEAQDEPFARIASTGTAMPGSPGGITFMHDRLWDEHPDVAAAFLRQHVRATELINDSPGEAAEAVSAALGERLTADLAERAIQSDAATYVTDPDEISDGTETCVERMRALGQIDEAVAGEELFERSIYRQATE